MQLLALSRDGQLISARQAHKQRSYHCLECQGRVRLRGGIHRQLHFYHSDPAIECRQHQKGMAHLQVQSYLCRLIGEADCSLEFRMPAIQRIADVVWHSEKIVFEIQCSPLSALEVTQRNRDYLKEGWRVVWILHDRRYNQNRYTAAEEALRSSPHYYTDMDQEGHGKIYDQFDHLMKGWRHHRLTPLKIEIRDLKRMTPRSSDRPLPRLVKRRMNEWGISFKGDLVDLFINNKDLEYMEKVVDKEKVILNAERQNRQTFNPFQLFLYYYRIIFHYFLEKSTR